MSDKAEEIKGVLKKHGVEIKQKKNIDDEKVEKKDAIMKEWIKKERIDKISRRIVNKDNEFLRTIKKVIQDDNS